MTESERLLLDSLKKLSAESEAREKRLTEQLTRLSDVQQQQAQLIKALSQRVEMLTQLLQE